MKRTHLLAIFASLAIIIAFTADASAYYHPTMGRFISRDPGAGSATRAGAARPTAGGQFIQRDPVPSTQYADGMNLYQYVRSNPIILVDPQGLWSWRNTNDVYIIQTVLNNNTKRFGLDLGNYGTGGNGIDGKYGPKTRAAVCKFQKELVKAGCGLPKFGVDGKWGQETTTAFEQCEKAGKVNWRYAHIRLGAFVGVAGITPWAGGGASGGAHAHLKEQSSVEWNFGALTFTTDDTTGGHVSADIYVVLAWNIFNAEDWRSLGSTQGDWGASLGPLKSKLAKVLGKGGKVGLNVITTIVENKGNIEAAIEVIKSGVGNEIWRGKPGSAAFSYGIGLGGFKTLKSTNYHTTDFTIGN